MQALLFRPQERRMEGGLAQNQVQQRRIIRLDHKEEEFFNWDIVEGVANDHIRRIRPYPATNQVRVPRDSCSDGDLSHLSPEHSSLDQSYSASTHTVMRKAILYRSRRVHKGLYSRESSTAGGIVYFTCLSTRTGRAR